MTTQFQVSYTIYSDYYIFTSGLWYDMAGDFLDATDATEDMVRKVLQEFCGDRNHAADNPPFERLVINFR